jgi:hypothetical protein
MPTTVHNDAGDDVEIPDGSPVYLIVALDDVLQIPHEARNRFYRDFPAVIAALEASDNNIILWVDTGDDTTIVLRDASVPMEKMMEAARRHVRHHEMRRPMREMTTRFVARLALAFRAFMSDDHDDHDAHGGRDARARTRLN